MKSLTVTNSKGETFAALVDNEDHNYASRYQWKLATVRHKQYAYTQINGKTVFLHRLICDIAPGGPKIFFVDGNGLNCQRDNMAIVLIGDFWAKVDKSRGPEACWAWLGCSSGEYGALKVDGRIVAAHRHAYELANGSVPDQTPVLHTCKAPLCMNPAHMKLGQQRVLTAKPKKRYVDPADRFKGKAGRKKQP